MRRVVWLCLSLVAGPALAQGFPFPPTKTRTPTRTPIAVPTAVPTVSASTPTPVPPSPTSTPRPGDATVTIQLAVVVVGATSSRLTPVRYEVETGGVWYTLTPRDGKCWTDAAGRCPTLGLSPTFRITGSDGRTYQQRIPLSPPRVLMAQATASTDLITFTTPQP